MKKNNINFKFSDILIGLAFTLLLISIGVIITINFRPLYYMDIGLLNIEAASGLPREEIKANYDALIDYSSPFFRGELELPTLPSSTYGLIHFREVKNIFTAFYNIALISFIVCLAIIQYKKKKKDYSYLFVSSITAIVVPLIIGLIMVLNFDKAFVVFHRIFFNNDYWIFDPITDPIIQILPAEFFMHSAYMIIAIVLLGCLALFLIYKNLIVNTGIRNRRNKGLKI